MSKGLKHCPFCKGDKTEIIRRAATNSYNVPIFMFATMCMSCGAKTGYRTTKEEAEKAWNSRAD